MGGRSTSLFGLWGLVLVVFGVVAYAVTRGALAYSFLHIGLGLLLFAAAFGFMFVTCFAVMMSTMSKSFK